MYKNSISAGKFVVIFFKAPLQGLSILRQIACSEAQHRKPLQQKDDVSIFTFANLELGALICATL